MNRQTIDKPDVVSKMALMGFQIGGYNLAIHVNSVMKIISGYEGLTMEPLLKPGQENFLFNDQIIPVINLSPKVKQAGSPISERAMIMILETPMGAAALLVDSVDSLIDLNHYDVSADIPENIFGNIVIGHLSKGDLDYQIIDVTKL